MKITQDGCIGSATDGPTFTVSGSEVSITFSTGETTTGTVNEAVTEIAITEIGDTCTKGTVK